MNAKLNDRLNIKVNGKSLAFWFLIAASCPQVLAIAPIQAQNQNQVSANQTDVVAVASRIIDINSSVAGDRLSLTLNFASSDRPQLTYSRQGNGDSLVLSLETKSSTTQGSISAANAPESGSVTSQANSPENSKVLTAQNTTDASVGKPLFEPKVTITDAEGKPRSAQINAPNTSPPSVANPISPQFQGRVPGVVPPFRQLRTPPVGDIATSTAKLRPDIVDLGTAERVPRITLRDAPAIEILTLIGRVAGLSVVSAEAPAAAGAAATAATGGLKQPVSLSIENETAQDVFNNVLRISGLEANRIGNTIFVATKLPVTLKNLATKSYRLNQITVGEASAYLIGLGASRVVNRQRVIPGAQTAVVGTTTAVVTTTTTTESVPTLETVAITPDSGATPLLKGLQIIAEERSNSLTLIGSPRQIDFAEAQLARLDLRKRQVVINVRVVEVNLSDGLNGQDTTGTLTLTGGNPSFNTAIVGTLGITFNSNQPLALPTSFIAGLRTSLSSGRAKILTDPSITVQEGENASISLTEDVVTKNTISNTSTGGVVSTSQTVTTEPVGLALNINISRVDDNGFINLSVSPSVTAPDKTVDTAGGNPALAGSFVNTLSRRTLNSGQIRLRDGQTLVLSGIIRDSDRQTIAKVPILGDLPIIGALFRGERTFNNRSEVVVIVTPRIIDDSQNANWGYTYQASPETQKVIDSNQGKTQ
jgi:type IV pilus assembly protein PilQ